MLQNEKIHQAKLLLQKLNIDAWITSGRETGMNNDPILPYISTIDFTALMAIIITKSGESIALVGHNDEEGTRQLDLYDKVIGYDTKYESELLNVIEKIGPNRVALNYSDYDVAADGISHGVFLRISKLLYSYNSDIEIISAENIIGTLRGSKTETERNRVLEAIDITQKIYNEAKSFIREGVSEIEIYNFFNEKMKLYGVEPSWEPSQCPGVMAGVSSVVGHNAPTKITAKQGDVITVDFGVRKYGYCSDLQRVYYILKDDENKAPQEVEEALNTIQEGIRRAASAMKPGAKVYDVDSIAREYIISKGFPSWNYALGHEIGRFAHDGGLLLAPKWDRYENSMLERVLEEGMMFTLEPGIKTSYGFVGQEEVAFVGKDGGIILSKQQECAYLV